VNNLNLNKSNYDKQNNYSREKSRLPSNHYLVQNIIGFNNNVTTSQNAVFYNGVPVEMPFNHQDSLSNVNPRVIESPTKTNEQNQTNSQLLNQKQDKQIASSLLDDANVFKTMFGNNLNNILSNLNNQNID